MGTVEFPQFFNGDCDGDVRGLYVDCGRACIFTHKEGEHDAYANNVNDKQSAALTMKVNIGYIHISTLL